MAAMLFTQTFRAHFFTNHYISAVYNNFSAPNQGTGYLLPGIIIDPLKGRTRYLHSFGTFTLSFFLQIQKPKHLIFVKRKQFCSAAFDVLRYKFSITRHRAYASAFFRPCQKITSFYYFIIILNICQ